MRQSPWLTGLQSFFIIWTLLRSSFTACNPELAILSSLKLLYCISCSLDGDLFLFRVQYRFSILDSRLPYLLVQGFGNGTSTKTIAGKLFGRRRVNFWLRRVTCLMLGISLPNWQQNARKTPPVLEKKEKKPERCNLVTYSWCSASGSFSLLPVVCKVHEHIIAL